LLLLHAAVEIVERAQGNVFLIRRGAWPPLELLSSQAHQFLELALPQALRSPCAAIF
jgi:hypothetical protein